MGAPKFTPSDLGHLYQKGQEQAQKDKKLIEALRQRLNDKLQDPKLARKAAQILESWIHQKRK